MLCSGPNSEGKMTGLRYRDVLNDVATLISACPEWDQMVVGDVKWDV